MQDYTNRDCFNRDTIKVGIIKVRRLRDRFIMNSMFVVSRLQQP